MHDPQAMIGELHLVGNIGVQQADRVARRGIAEAGMEFFGNRGPADNAARLKHLNLIAAARKIPGAYQAIMACADDESLFSCHG